MSAESGQTLDCRKCGARGAPRLRYCGPSDRRPACHTGEHLHRTCPCCSYTDFIPSLDNPSADGAPPA